MGGGGQAPRMCMRHGAKLVACGDPSTHYYVASTLKGVERGSTEKEGRVAQTSSRMVGIVAGPL